MGEQMKKLGLAFLAALAPSSAFAVPLWHDVENGMTADQVHMLYPRGDHVEYKNDETVIHDYAVTERCHGDVHIDHPHGTVTQVRIRGGSSMAGRCSEIVLDGLASRYGQPLSREHSHGSILAREGNIYIWHRDDGVTLRFKRFTNGAFGGGGLLAASWELTYSTVTENINL
jgi:hypothetical protein